MGWREQIARARRKLEDVTRVLRTDAPPAIGSGNAGCMYLNGRWQIPPFGVHPTAKGVPVCGGPDCPAWDRAADNVGICLVDPCAAGPESRGAAIAGETICPLAVQRMKADLEQALAWARYLQETARRGAR